MSRHNTPISDRRDDDTAQTLNLSVLQAGASEASARVAPTSRCKFPTMRRLDFKEASEVIKAVDAELEALLSVVWDQAAEACQRDLCFFLARYPYKHFVFKNGQALDPDGQPLGADLLVADQLPVGLILDN